MGRKGTLRAGDKVWAASSTLRKLKGKLLADAGQSVEGELLEHANGRQVRLFSLEMTSPSWRCPLALPLGAAPWRCPLPNPLPNPRLPACLFACLCACLRLCGALWAAVLGCGGLCCGFGLRLWLWLWAVALGCGGLCCCQRPSPLPPPGVLDTTTFLFFSFSSPECGATLWYRYLMMPHVAFSVAVVAK